MYETFVSLTSRAYLSVRQRSHTPGARDISSIIKLFFFSFFLKHQPITKHNHFEKKKKRKKEKANYQTNEARIKLTPMLNTTNN